MLADREGHIVSIGRTAWAADHLDALATPQLGAGSIGKLPDVLARAAAGKIEKIIGPKPGRETGTGGKRDGGRRRHLRRRIIHLQPPQCCFWIGYRKQQAAPVSAGRKRSVAIKPRRQPVGNAALDIHAVKKRARTVSIAR